ncbi:hypothetical protein AURDEDRAFT_180911 [Auricularia subglabra TFB-10046 SS5]|nr:hypothetical protein AURDEDRAFT_180911 [Auricularia subglabra TFB-10046 SS5]
MAVDVVGGTATASSVLFRALVYIYLRVIPARFFKYLLPPLYLITLAANAAAYKQKELALKELAPPQDVDLVVEETEETKVEVERDETNGDVTVKEETTTTTEVVAVPAVQPEPEWRSQARTAARYALGLERKIVWVDLALLTLLGLFALDFTLHPVLWSYDDVAFTRVGAVLHNSVKIQARYPGLRDDANNTVAKIVYRTSAVPGAPWKDGPKLNFVEDNDYVAVATIKGLYPSSSYEYQLAYENSTLLPYPAAPIVFRTFPDPRLASGSGSHFKFLVSSCATPNFPYRPLSGTRVKGFDLLAKYLWSPNSATAAPQPAATEVPAPEATKAAETSATTPSATPEVAAPVPVPEAEASTATISTETVPPTTAEQAATTSVKPAASPAPTPDVPVEFMLFLGDFIYADVPLGTTTREWYRKLYRRMYASPSFRKIYERIPIFSIYDDHEFENNFAGNGADHFTPTWTNGSSAFNSYLGSANYDTTKGAANYYDFRYGDTAFFVMDTRRYRSDASVEEAQRTMLGDKQLAAFHSWLGRVNGTATWKFVVSSVPLSSLWQYDAQTDAWAAFPKERKALIDALASVPNVVVLSGDRHQFAVIDYYNGGFPEISTSPASMFDVPWWLGRMGAGIQRISAETFKMNVTRQVENDEGGVETLAPVEQELPIETVVHYAPSGNYKVSSIEVDTRDHNVPALHLELINAGRRTYTLTFHGKPVRMSTTQALGRQLTQGFKDLLGAVRIKPGSWF